MMNIWMAVRSDRQLLHVAQVAQPLVQLLTDPAKLPAESHSTALNRQPHNRGPAEVARRAIDPPVPGQGHNPGALQKIQVDSPSQAPRREAAARGRSRGVRSRGACRGGEGGGRRTSARWLRGDRVPSAPPPFAMRKPPFRAAWIGFDGGAEGLDTAGGCAGCHRQTAKRAACDSAQVTVLRVPEAPPRNENSHPPGWLRSGVAGPKGLEPSTSGVTGRRSNQLNYDPAFRAVQGWWEVGDLNPRPPACKAGALPLS